ncbi:MAG: transporter [Eubacteriales bacterium]|nr:transporter [Eubacteriales bacterium]
MKKKITGKDLLILQGVVMVFSITSVVANFASKQELLSAGFFLFYGLEVLVLAVYALLWQQVIKKFDISIAYANKAMVLLWGMLWSVLIFRNGVAPKEIAGVLFVIAGVIVLNREETDGREEVADREAKA